jgi:hypothetical protein
MPPQITLNAQSVTRDWVLARAAHSDGVRHHRCAPTSHGRALGWWASSTVAARAVFIATVCGTTTRSFHTTAHGPLLARFLAWLQLSWRFHSDCVCSSWLWPRITPWRCSAILLLPRHFFALRAVARRRPHRPDDRAPQVEEGTGGRLVATVPIGAHRCEVERCWLTLPLPTYTARANARTHSCEYRAPAGRFYPVPGTRCWLLSCRRVRTYRLGCA